eukprot:TRINITY_DN6532_c0_g1_i1.p1 TRINITY_DN6532_c0_g1~~TRINITY_DN6532_c0_g1_i1.p1  ORF type:complete len:454 (-),score=87.40 TRINITY_DN6532_c0_g1_i1:87-1448(-)
MGYHGHNRSNSAQLAQPADFPNNCKIIRDERLLLIIVGLPARGKSFISGKLSRYLHFRGMTSKIFHIGQYRRKGLSQRPEPDFFSKENLDGLEKRKQHHFEALQDAMKQICDGSLEVGIIDGLFLQESWRKEALECIRESLPDLQVAFLELITTDDELVENNIKNVQIKSAKYSNMSAKEATADFKKKLGFLEEQYETMTEKEGLDYIKYYNAGETIRVRNVAGPIGSRIVFNLMQTHIQHRCIWLSRHGEAEDNVTGRVGGDSSLTPQGEKYAQQLGDFVNILDQPNIQCWTSTMERAVESTKYLPPHVTVKKFKALDEISLGISDGMTLEEMRKKNPEIYCARMKDKFGYRPPRGESYSDLVERLEPLIMEMERTQGPVIIVAHKAVLRVIMGYFLESPLQTLPQLKVPLHHVIKISHKLYHMVSNPFYLGVPLTDGCRNNDWEDEDSPTS